MLKPIDQIYCGIYDSTITRKNEIQSADRIVTRFELELFLADTGVSFVDGVAHSTKKGMLLCIHPGQIRHAILPVRCAFVHVILPPDDTEHPEIMSVLKSLPTHHLLTSEEEIDKLTELFIKLGNCFITHSDEHLNTLRINSIFLEILVRLSIICKQGVASSENTNPSRLVHEAVQFIYKNYDKDCSLDAIAAAAYVSPNYLHSIFVKTTGITPLKYTHKRRVERAKQLILEGELSMLEIAMQTGFCSQSHFHKVFKSICGETPNSYRKRLLEQYL